MGWLSNIFKPKKEGEPQAQQEMELKDAIPALDAKMREKDAKSEGDLRAMHEKMKTSSAEFSESMKSMMSAQGPEKIDEGLMNLVKSYRLAMSKAFGNVEAEFGKDVSYTVRDLKNYFDRCAGSLAEAEQSVMRYVTPLKEVFPGEMGKVLKKSEQVNGVVASVKTDLDKKIAEVAPLSDAMKSANELDLHVADLAGAASQVESAKKKLSDLEARKVELEKDLSDLLSSGDWSDYQSRLAEMSAIEKKKDGMRAAVLSSLVVLDRPMKKLKKISADLGQKLDDEDMFNMYINDPVEAFLSDDDQAVIMKIVAKIKDIYEKAPADFDSKKDQKIMDTVSSLESGEFLRKLRSDYDDAQRATEKLGEELKGLDVLRQKAEIDAELKKVVSDIPEQREEIMKLGSLHAKMSERKDELLAKLRADLSRAVGEEIKVRVA